MLASTRHEENARAGEGVFQQQPLRLVPSEARNAQLLILCLLLGERLAHPRRVPPAKLPDQSREGRGNIPAGGTIRVRGEGISTRQPDGQNGAAAAPKTENTVRLIVSITGQDTTCGPGTIRTPSNLLCGTALNTRRGSAAKRAG
eukprot:1183361-Prorocentrum_minimum.AAC.1